MTTELQTEFRAGALYAIWDEANHIIGEYIGHHAGLGLPEFRPLVWEGEEAEPCRNVCAGLRAQVRAIADRTERSSTH